MPEIPGTATRPRRIQRKRTKGWKLPEGAVVVDRTTRWGNPWSMDQGYTRHQCVTRFKTYLIVRRNPPAGWADLVGYPSDEEIRRELVGRDLVCWCAPDAECHADVLLSLANGDDDA